MQRVHLFRDTTPPWRQTRGATDCGKPIDPDGTANGAQVFTWDELTAFVAKHGQQRAAILTCMTCYNTHRNYRPWSVDPVTAIAREAHSARSRRKPDTTLATELKALARLVELHPDEFAAIIDGLNRTDDLAAARQRRRHGTAR